MTTYGPYHYHDCCKASVDDLAAYIRYYFGLTLRPADYGKTWSVTLDCKSKKRKFIYLTLI